MGAYGLYSDQQLITFLQQGDEQAFTEIYNRYWQRMFVLASRKLFDLEEAREVVQNIFINLWERRARLEIDSTLSAYLSVCVKYRIINTLDKHYVRKKHAAEFTAAVAHNTTEEWLEFEETRERLARLVADLPEKCRMVFTMSRDKGMSQKQIAEALHISEKTVEAHLGKALKTLKAGLRSYLLL
ncbi:RNA polymerase sigma-70 factor [Chitinophaga sp.]|uniref:RNA polymerase sigma-70 factor n=1 Tax=Chitinophaga sp. TaxID=1869181 RepID=UPI0031D978E6